MQADLVEVPAALEAVHAAFEHEEAHALVPLGGIGLHGGDHEVGVDAVRDERLRTVHDVGVAVPDGRGPHRREVRADRRLGHGDGGDQLTRADTRQPPLLLLVRREVREVRQADVVVQRDAQARAGHTGALDLFADHEVVAKVVDATAAVLLGHGHTEEPVRTGSKEQLARDGAGGLPFEVVRRDLLVDECPERLAEQVVLVGEQRSLHHRQM